MMGSVFARSEGAGKLIGWGDVGWLADLLARWGMVSGRAQRELIDADGCF
jgi:hypothetical protein